MKTSHQRAHIGYSILDRYLSNSGKRDHRSESDKISAAIECLLYLAHTNNYAIGHVIDTAKFQVEQQLKIEGNF